MSDVSAGAFRTGLGNVAPPDFGKTADDYSKHRPGFPDSLFDRLDRFNIGRAGQAVLDLGTGTGHLARSFARRGCRVSGVDIAKELLVEARRLDIAEGLDIQYRLARVEDTGLPPGGFDVVSAGQCWHWFDRDAAAQEAKRLLCSGGKLLIAHFDWLALSGNVAHATEALIERHSPTWKWAGGLGIYPQWLRDAQEAGFEKSETFTYDVNVPFSHEGWRGRVRASAGIRGTLSEDGVRWFDDDLANMLDRQFPDLTLEVTHRIFALVASLR